LVLLAANWSSYLFIGTDIYTWACGATWIASLASDQVVAGSNPVMPDDFMNGTNGKESRERLLAKILAIIRKNPGIRPSEINRRIKMEHSASLRSALIKKGLVKKKRKGSAVRYYPT
jgi:hypothetical protein